MQAHPLDALLLDANILSIARRRGWPSGAWRARLVVSEGIVFLSEQRMSPRLTTKPTAKGRNSHGLPEELRPFFWEYDFRTLSWDADRDFITGRLLTHGDWNAVQWLRSYAGDETIREWLESRRGRGVSPQRRRFWELLLSIPHRRVNEWLAGGAGPSWWARAQ